MKKKPRPAVHTRPGGIRRVRRVWRLSPVERVRESARRYCRKKARGELREEYAACMERPPKAERKM